MNSVYDETRDSALVVVDMLNDFIDGSMACANAKEAVNRAAEFIDSMMGEDEVSEIWLTFSDPQMKKATKRLTSTYFMERYRRFLKDGGIIHLKTDSQFLYTYTKLMAEKNGLPIEADTADLYAEAPESEAASIQTYYEQMWLERGLSIKYLRFRLPRTGELVEPDEDIPVDGYRSYGHEVRSTRQTGR